MGYRSYGHCMGSALFTDIGRSITSRSDRAKNQLMRTVLIAVNRAERFGRMSLRVALGNAVLPGRKFHAPRFIEAQPHWKTH